MTTSVYGKLIIALLAGNGNGLGWVGWMFGRRESESSARRARVQMWTRGPPGASRVDLILYHSPTTTNDCGLIGSKIWKSVHVARLSQKFYTFFVLLIFILFSTFNLIVRVNKYSGTHQLIRSGLNLNS